MKKIYSFTISLTLVLIANTSVAQWTTNGNDVYKTNTLGNVGIGTTSPNGRLQFSNNLENRKIVLWEGANNDHEYFGLGVNPSMLRYQTHGGSSHVFYTSTSSTTSSELMRIEGYSGNVGIGTPSPNAKLDVAGIVNIKGGGYLRVGPYNSSTDNFGYVSSAGQITGTGLKFETASSTGIGGVTGMTILNNGNVARSSRR